MTAKETLLQFENVLKENAPINISKTKERNKKEWKLIYDIEGLIYNDIYIPYVKFVFFMNEDLDDFSEDVLIYGNGVDYITIQLNEIDSVYDKIIKDKFILEFSNIVINAVTKLNELTDTPFIAFEQKIYENGVMPMSKKYLSFVLNRINSDINIMIKADLNAIYIDNEKINIDNTNKIYFNIIEKIDKK